MNQNPIDKCPNTLPPSANFHLWKPCNYACRHCFATFDDDPKLRAIKTGLPTEKCIELIRLLRYAGVRKLTFAGGEPTLCPHLPDLVCFARSLGMTTSLVTNGARLPRVLDAAPGSLDWVALSVDSSDENTNARLGRRPRSSNGAPCHVKRSLELSELLHERRIGIKLNTVVTSLSWREDMSDFVRRIRPERWKIFQVLPVIGQQAGPIDDLLISADQFKLFVDRHLPLEQEGIKLVPETNEDMTNSYVMIDPIGRFFSIAEGRYCYSEPILDVGVECAFAQTRFEFQKYHGRGGEYGWVRPGAVSLTLNGVSP